MSINKEITIHSYSSENTKTYPYLLSKYAIQELNEQLFNKITYDLSNKYRGLICEREFPLYAYKFEIMKDIKRFRFYKCPFYNQLFHLIEKKFLKEITLYQVRSRSGLLTRNMLHDIIQSNTEYNYNSCVTYDVGKISLGHVVNKNDVNQTLDKFKPFQAKQRPMSKHEKMIQYNCTIHKPTSKK